VPDPVCDHNCDKVTVNFTPFGPPGFRLAALAWQNRRWRGVLPRRGVVITSAVIGRPVLRADYDASWRWKRPPALIDDRRLLMHVTQLEWIITLSVTIAVLLFDVVVIGRRPHEPSKRELVTALTIYIGLAIGFGLWTWFYHGSQYGLEFFAGWLTEYSLSVDNLFIFLIIMASFKVPKMYQQQALLVGIILALIFRGIFIALGAVAIQQFSWVFYIFGAFLVYTAIGLARNTEHDDDAENVVVRFAQSHLKFTDQWAGLRLWIKENGKRLMTPMFLVIVALGTTDLIFALDSIPAIYGLTQEPYLVFTANVFALMGLRQLYFLLGDLLKRLVYLSQGLAFVLFFIGVKLVLHALHENEVPFINGGQHVPVPEIPTLLSLGVIVVTLVITTAASLYKTRVHDVRNGQTEQAEPTESSKSLDSR
jgi:tellurite resistance protein TerC